MPEVEPRTTRTHNLNALLHHQLDEIDDVDNRYYTWRDDALCKGKTDTFFPSDDKFRKKIQAAIKICESCVVITECGEYADSTDQRWGVWAGKYRGPKSKNGSY